MHLHNSSMETLRLGEYSNFFPIQGPSNLLQRPFTTIDHITPTCTTVLELPSTKQQSYGPAFGKTASAENARVSQIPNINIYNFFLVSLSQ